MAIHEELYFIVLGVKMLGVAASPLSFTVREDVSQINSLKKAECGIYFPSFIAPKQLINCKISLWGSSSFLSLM